MFMTVSHIRCVFIAEMRENFKFYTLFTIKSAVEFSSIFNPTSSQTSRIAVSLGVSLVSNVPVTDCQRWDHLGAEA